MHCGKIENCIYLSEDISQEKLKNLISRAQKRNCVCSIVIRYNVTNRDLRVVVEDHMGHHRQQLFLFFFDGNKLFIPR